MPITTGTKEAANTSTTIKIVIALWSKHVRNTLAYHLSTASKARPTVFAYVKRLLSSLALASASSALVRKNFLPLSILEQSIGVREIATTVDVHTTMVTIQPNSLNIIPAIPVSIVRGTNTATITKVVAITDVQTSLVAYIEASRGEAPRSM